MAGEAVKMGMDKGKAIESALLQIEKKFGKGLDHAPGREAGTRRSGRSRPIV